MKSNIGHYFIYVCTIFQQFVMAMPMNADYAENFSLSRDNRLACDTSYKTKPYFCFLGDFYTHISNFDIRYQCPVIHIIVLGDFSHTAQRTRGIVSAMTQLPILLGAKGEDTPTLSDGSGVVIATRNLETQL